MVAGARVGVRLDRLTAAERAFGQRGPRRGRGRVHRSDRGRVVAGGQHARRPGRRATWSAGRAGWRGCADEVMPQSLRIRYRRTVTHRPRITTFAPARRELHTRDEQVDAVLVVLAVDRRSRADRRRLPQPWVELGRQGGQAARFCARCSSSSRIGQPVLGAGLVADEPDRGAQRVTRRCWRPRAARSPPSRRVCSALSVRSSPSVQASTR